MAPSCDVAGVTGQCDNGIPLHLGLGKRARTPMARTLSWPRGNGEVTERERTHPARMAVVNICTAAIRPIAAVTTAFIILARYLFTAYHFPTIPMLSSARAWSFALALAFVRADVAPEGTPIGSLYAYGSGISGLPVIYSDGSPILPVSLSLVSANQSDRRCSSWLGTSRNRNCGHERDL